MRRALLISCLGALLCACPGPADEACAAYVACQAAYDEAFDLPATDVSDYAEGGRCWLNEPTRELCARNCAIALGELQAAAREAGVELAACQ